MTSEKAKVEILRCAQNYPGKLRTSLRQAQGKLNVQRPTSNSEGADGGGIFNFLSIRLCSLRLGGASLRAGMVNRTC